MLHKRLSVVVKDGGLGVSVDLQALDIGLVVAAFFGLFIVVHYGVFVACKELELKLLSVNHGWTQVQVLWIESALVVLGVSMSRTNLVDDSFEHALSLPVLRIVANLPLLGGRGRS